MRPPQDRPDGRVAPPGWSAGFNSLRPGRAWARIPGIDLDSSRRCRPQQPRTGTTSDPGEPHAPMAKFYTLDEAARTLGIPAEQLQAWIVEGRALATRRSGNWVIRDFEVRKLKKTLASSSAEQEKPAPGPGALPLHEESPAGRPAFLPLREERPENKPIASLPGEGKPAGKQIPLPLREGTAPRRSRNGPCTRRNPTPRRPARPPLRSSREGPSPLRSLHPLHSAPLPHPDWDSTNVGRPWDVAGRMPSI